MTISSLPRILFSAFKQKTSPLSITRTINYSTATTAEKYCNHLLNHPQNPEKTLITISAPLNANCVIQVLQTLSSSNQQSQLGLRFFIWAGAHPNYKHSQYMYRFACKLLQINKNPGKIRDVIECYIVEGVLFNVKLFKVVLNLCKEAKISDEGLWVLRKMKAFGCFPDSTMYNVVIGLFCEKGDLDLAMALLNEMESCGLCADMITLMSLLKGLCDGGRFEDACGLFRTMKSHGCAPNSVAYSALLDGLCRVGCFDKALALMAEMEKEVGGELAPNAITYTSVIRSLCENGKSVEAVSILERMERFKCCPNRVTMNVLIQGLCCEGHIDMAFELVGNLVARGRVLSGECYSSLVISLLRIKRFEDAEKLFKWMVESDVKPDGLACSMLMRNMCLEGRFVDAFSHYEDVEVKGFVLTIDSDIYSALLVGLCQEDCVVEVEKLVKLMIEKGIRINASYVDNIHKHLKGSVGMEALAELFRMKR